MGVESFAVSTLVRPVAERFTTVGKKLAVEFMAYAEFLRRVLAGAVGYSSDTIFFSPACPATKARFP